MSDEAGGVAAVERALSILDALTDDKVTLAELSKRTGLYKSTVLRLLKSLERFGYVLRTEGASYRLGAKVLHLGSTYQRYFKTSEIVPPILVRLAEDLHEGATFYIAEDAMRVALHRVDASRAVRDSVHEGDRLPLTVGAAGHVLRAFAGEPGERMDQIRTSMYCASFGERDAETAAVACPVLGVHQKVVGALSISGPRYRIEALGTDRILPTLFKYAQALTQTFGGRLELPASATSRSNDGRPQTDARSPVPAKKAARPASALAKGRAAPASRKP
jgi:DNA-binding IclR family transcriptional regulator